MNAGLLYSSEVCIFVMSLLSLLETTWGTTTRTDYTGPLKMRSDPKRVGHVAASANGAEREDTKGSLGLSTSHSKIPEDLRVKPRRVEFQEVRDLGRV